jgi:hypothetical protein
MERWVGLGVIADNVMNIGRCLVLQRARDCACPAPWGNGQGNTKVHRNPFTQAHSDELCQSKWAILRRKVARKTYAFIL